MSTIFIIMSKPHCLAILVTVIGVLIIQSSVEVDAQSTVDDSASCESSTLDDAVSIIREDLKDVKNLLGSSQQQINVSRISKKDLEDLKVAFDASTQQQNNASSLFNKAVSLIREDLADVTNIFGSKSAAEQRIKYLQKGL